MTTPEHPVDDYRRLIGAWEDGVLRHGASPRALGWPTNVSLVTHFDVMLDIARRETAGFSLLDLGCGTGLLLDYLQARTDLPPIAYKGVDVSPMIIDVARQQWPDHDFEVRDILAEPFAEASFDYTIVDGVCTTKAELSQAEMEAFAKALMTAAWRSTRKALAINFMSIHVDWTRDDLFHWPIDAAVAHCKRELSRHVAIRADYGAWEYTLQVYREPIADSIATPARWLNPDDSP
jgi:SAM-dependent methyltransferase